MRWKIGKELARIESTGNIGSLADEPCRKSVPVLKIFVWAVGVTLEFTLAAGAYFSFLTRNKLVQSPR